jgi:hypothetical protein
VEGFDVGRLQSEQEQSGYKTHRKTLPLMTRMTLIFKLTGAKSPRHFCHLFRAAEAALFCGAASSITLALFLVC